jgi:hypothetical protein
MFWNPRLDNNYADIKHIGVRKTSEMEFQDMEKLIAHQSIIDGIAMMLWLFRTVVSWNETLPRYKKHVILEYRTSSSL